MGTILEETIDAETQHLLERRAEWSIPAGARDLELTAHALRVLLQLDRVAEDASEFLALADAQRADGGWNSALDDAPSAPWVSAFAALTCARAARALAEPRLAPSASPGPYFPTTRNAGARFSRARQSGAGARRRPTLAPRRRGRASIA